MAEAIVSSIVDMLGNLLTQEVSFLSGVKSQVEEIKTEFESMQCFLEDADRKSNKDKRVGDLIKRVRKVAYGIEDVLETYAIKVKSKKGKGVKSKLKRCVCILDEGVDLHKLGVKIEDIKTEIAKITPGLQDYCTKSEKEGQSSNAPSKNSLRQTVAHDTEEHFVGMQNDIDKLVKLMIDRIEGRRIISICGMGGLGKTTLAKKVFHHGDVRKHFGSFAWVSLSQQFEQEDVLRDILRQLDVSRNKNDIERMKSPELRRELHEFQTEKKCLVVLDDIWKTEHWDALSDVFPTTSVDCKVLLTTRIQGVAEIGITHKPGVLSEEEGWELLKKKAFNSQNSRDFNPEAAKEDLGKEIVGKCGYVPLAVSVIGGILRKEETLEGWENVKENISSYLRCGDGVEENYRVMQILTLSYDDLPYRLKPCLLYLAYYPEDAEINLQELYWMWIAEGLILSKDQRRNESLMEVAERYLNVLASRSLVQVQLNEEIDGISKSCRIHDLIRDLCVRKCEEEDFLKVIDRRKSKQQKYYLNSAGGNAYRLVMYRSKDDGNVYRNILHEANEGTRVFSLRSLGKYLPHEIACGVLKDLENLRFLRILTFDNVDLSNTKVLDKVMQKLIHLRCLSFVECKLEEVPSSVGELSYLQTFYLKDHCVVKMTNVFWKLKRLLHFVWIVFYLDISPSELEWEFSGVETLFICNEYHTAIKDLSKLTNPRVIKLSVHDSKNLSLIIDFIMKSKRDSKLDITVKIIEGTDFIGTDDGPILLRKLFSCHAIQHLLICDVRIRELPKYELGMLSDLVDLKMSYNDIEKDPMPTLEKLPKLKILLLESDSFVAEEFICSSTGFPNLKELRLADLRKLKSWTIDEGAMPILSTVTIFGCKKLEMIPTGMKFLKALENLSIWGMPKEFNDRIRIVNGEEGVDLHKVCHVPSIHIGLELKNEEEITVPNWRRPFWRRREE